MDDSALAGTKLSCKQVGLVCYLCCIVSVVVCVLTAVCWIMGLQAQEWSWLVFTTKVVCPLVLLGSLFVSSLLGAMTCVLLGKLGDEEENEFFAICQILGWFPSIGIAVALVVILYIVGQFLFAVFK